MGKRAEGEEYRYLAKIDESDLAITKGKLGSSLLLDVSVYLTACRFVITHI